MAYPSSIIVNKPLCTDIFPHLPCLLKLAKDDNKLLGHYPLISLFSSLSNVFKKSYLSNLVTNGLSFENQ